MKQEKFSFILVYYNQTNIDRAEEVNSAAIEEFNCDGIEEFSLEEARVDEILGERAYSGGDIPESLIDEVQNATSSQDEITYKYFFSGDDHFNRAQSLADFLKSHIPDLAMMLVEEEVQDWNAQWRKFYTPIKVSPRIEIIPEWLKASLANSSLHQVFIYPGMGFGTGTHETTYLCLKLFDQIASMVSTGGRCLDFGCGSGILGIAAMKAHSMPTTFCDIDPSALDNCVQNLVLNFEGQNLQGTNLVIRDRLQIDQYEVVFANILDHVLKLEKDVLLKSLKPKSYLIVSGLLNSQVDGIVSTFSELKKVEVLSKNDWSAILFQRIL